MIFSSRLLIVCFFCLTAISHKQAAYFLGVSKMKRQYITCIRTNKSIADCCLLAVTKCTSVLSVLCTPYHSEPEVLNKMFAVLFIQAVNQYVAEDDLTRKIDGYKGKMVCNRIECTCIAILESRC